MRLSGQFNLQNKTNYQIRGLYRDAFNNLAITSKKEPDHRKAQALLSAVRLRL